MCRCLSPTSEIRAEIQLTSGHAFWAKHRQGSATIDLKSIFDDYWSSSKQEFVISSQWLCSPTRPLILNKEAQALFKLESIIALWNYNSPQALLFVSLPLPIQVANDVRIGEISPLVAP